MVAGREQVTSLSPTSHQVQAFRNMIATATGLLFEVEQTPRLPELLKCRAQKHHLPVEKYLCRLLQNGPEIQALAQILVVGETYFFRHTEQLQAYAQEALPNRSRARPTQEVRIVSVGCSSGEEPYSLAILAQMAGFPKTRLKISALDINLESLEKAKLGIYSPWSLRVTPPDLRTRWFTERGQKVTLDPSILNSVTFTQANLAEKSSVHWMPDSYDIIFCRNVLMYFGLAGAQQGLERLRDSLAPGGYLFLGHAESLRGSWLDEFELLHTHNCFYYRKSEKRAQAAKPIRASKDGAVQTKQARSEPIPVLANDSPNPSPVSYRGHIAKAWQLLEWERFAEAHQAVSDDEGEVLNHPEAKLLGAVALVNLGEYDSAEKTCHTLLESSGPKAGVHYLLGLCKEGRQDFAAAVREHRQSSILDTAFAMPRIHLALLARRSGDVTAAYREFEVARLLLHHEKPRRLRLFSAGFGRNALLQLCDTELSALAAKRGRLY